jgi:lactate permease
LQSSPVSLINFLLALSPIVTVLVLMVGFKWGGAKAGAAGWLMALAIAVIFFGANPEVLAFSQMRGMLLTLYVLYVVWMALVLFNVVREAGAIEQIGRAISSMSGDRLLQLLILSWVFSSFLQGVAGYGVPIAVIAPLLIGLGFDPVLSVSAVAAGHAWSVNFGSIAASFNAMIATSGMSGEALAPWSAILLGIVCFFSGIATAFLYEGWKSIKHGLPAILIFGIVMSLVQYLMAVNGLWNISAFVAGMAGLATSVAVSRLKIYRSTVQNNLVTGAPVQKGQMPTLLAFSAYIILIFVVGTAELFPPVHNFLNQIKLVMLFPETQTDLGWVIQASKGQTISLFGHAGALLIYSSIAAYFLYSVAGRYKPGALQRIWENTRKSGLLSSIGIIAMVGFALIMEQSGMTNTIAVGLSRSVEGIYPFFSPFIGVLGSFMTGSNTNSNIVFVGLQKYTAELLNLPVALILAAQTTGGSIGGMLAPARIIVGCSTAGLSGKEGLVLQRVITIGMVMTVIIGLITLAFV